MTLSIKTNIAAVTAQRHLSGATQSVSLQQERLGSGLRINKASDDAAGLAVASSLKNESRLYTQAIRNVADAISLLTVADGGLEALTTIGLRQLELAEQSSNGVYSVQQRRALDTETQALSREYDRIIASTTFNRLKPLDGSLSAGISVQTGIDSSGITTVALGERLGRLVGNGTFDTPSITSFGGTMSGIAAADFNGDGKVDVMGVNYTNSRMMVAFGNGDGTFTAFTSRLAGIATQPYDLAVGDLDGDGRADFVTANNFSGGVNVVIGNGDGSFKWGVYLPGGNTTHAVDLADLNGDGFTDIFTVNTGSSNISVFLGNGNGTFKAASLYTTGTNPEDVAGADLNGDGLIDLVSADRASNTISVLLGNGDGSFKARTTVAAPMPYSVTVADMNRDGRLDLLSGNNSTLAILSGNGDGTFKASSQYSIGGGWGLDLEVVDLNDDGNNDVISSNRFNATLSVLMGNGNGTYRAATSFASGNQSFRLATADFDLDGVLDIATADQGGTITIAKGLGTVTNYAPRLDITTRDGARSALETIRSTLDRIGAEKGNIGAVQRRLESIERTITVTRENTETAYSRIMDTDISLESSLLLEDQIRREAAASILAQANQAPRLALSLLSA